MILKMSQDIHVKVVIFAESHDKIRIFWIVGNFWGALFSPGHDMKRPGNYISKKLLISVLGLQNDFGEWLHNDF